MVTFPCLSTLQTNVFRSSPSLGSRYTSLFFLFTTAEWEDFTGSADIWDHQRSLRAFFKLGLPTSTGTLDIKNALIPHKHVCHSCMYSLWMSVCRYEIEWKCKMVRGYALYWGDCRPRPRAKAQLKVPDQLATCPRMPIYKSSNTYTLPVDLEVEVEHYKCVFYWKR